jgi:hypothetical protein
VIARRLSYQFHAAPEELLFTLVPEWLTGVRAHLVAESLRAEDRRVAVEGTDLRAAQAALGSIDWVLAGLTPFHAPAARWNEFAASNPDFLVIHVGRFTSDGLRESAIGSTATDPLSATTWRKVVSRAKKSMLKGAVAVNPYGARFPQPKHAYTAGALEMQRSGTVMLAAAGSVKYELGSQT